MCGSGVPEHRQTPGAMNCMRGVSLGGRTPAHRHGTYYHCRRCSAEFVVGDRVLAVDGERFVWHAERLGADPFVLIAVSGPFWSSLSSMSSEVRRPVSKSDAQGSDLRYVEVDEHRLAGMIRKGLEANNCSIPARLSAIRDEVSAAMTHAVSRAMSQAISPLPAPALSAHTLRLSADGHWATRPLTDIGW